MGDGQQVAVIGCGQWGKNLVRNFHQLGALRCVCDVDDATLRTLSRRYPTVRLASRLEDVLHDSSVQAVVIATPASMHYAHARQAILSGKDVFVEKPLALEYHAGAELVRLADAHGVILMVGHILEYHPAVTALKQIVRRGELGRMWYLYSNRLNLGKVRKEENILWSFAPHDISVISSLAGSAPEVVSASGGSYLQPGVVDVTITNLLFANGVKAHIFVSWLHPYKEQRLVVVGERKMAVFDDTVREGKLKLYSNDITWRAGVLTPRQKSEAIVPLEDTEPLRLECQHFLDAIRDRTPPLTGGESALQVLKVLAACQMSLEQGGVPVPLSQVQVEAPT